MSSVIQYLGAAPVVVAINLKYTIPEASQIGILFAFNGILLTGVFCVGRSAHSLGGELSQLGRLVKRDEDPPVTFPEAPAAKCQPEG